MDDSSFRVPVGPRIRLLMRPSAIIPESIDTGIEATKGPEVNKPFCIKNKGYTVLSFPNI